MPALKRRPSFRACNGMRTRRAGPSRERAWPCRCARPAASARVLPLHSWGTIYKADKTRKLVRCVLCVRAAILIHWSTKSTGTTGGNFWGRRLTTPTCASLHCAAPVVLPRPPSFFRLRWTVPPFRANGASGARDLCITVKRRYLPLHSSGSDQ